MTLINGEQIKKLEAERDALKEQNAALAAQVEALKSAVIAVRDVPKRSGFQVNDPNPKAERLAWMRLNEVLSATPQQHLAEIRAEAGRAGYLQGVHDWQLAEINYEDFDTQSRSAQYADSIRQGVESVEITEQSLLPDEFVSVEVVTKPDKNAIKAALKSGQDVPGAALVRGKTTIVIK